jgi:hypothetical protein
MAKSKVVKTKGTVENSASVIKAAGLPTLPQPLAKKVATAITAKADPLGMEAGLKAIAAAPVVVKENDVAAGSPPKGTVSAKEATLNVFKKSPDKEFKTADVVAAVAKSGAKVQGDTILWMITTLKQENVIHRVRNDGHQHVLKFGPAPQGAVVSTKAAVKASPAAASDGLAGVLKEMMALVEQRAVIDARIAELKKLI